MVEIRAKSKSAPVVSPIVEAHEKYMPPSWLKVDSGNLKIEVTGLPAADDFEQAIDVRQVIEYYSRR